MDPAGNQVELQAGNFGGWKPSGEFMHTSSDFRSNQTGTFFDPDIARTPERLVVGHSGLIDHGRAAEATELRRADGRAPGIGPDEVGHDAIRDPAGSWRFAGRRPAMPFGAG